MHFCLPATETLRINEKNGVPFYSFPSLDALNFVRHGFSTRFGGVSEGVFASMNCSFTRGDDETAVKENFRRICSAIGVNAENTVISAQTHTTNVRCITASDRGRGFGREKGYTDVDGLITDEPGVVLCTQYADCVPLFFADPVKRVVATSHGGWRGTVGGIALETVKKMEEQYGCNPKDIIAGIGPSIGKCCFEVDAPVYEAFSVLPFWDKDCYTEDGGGKYHLDLWEVNRRFMMLGGVPEHQITVTDVCTRCHPDALWSHRFTGNARGSLAAFIAIAE